MLTYFITFKLYIMLDFKKLEEGLSRALAKETTESVDKWFREQEMLSLKSYLGEGTYSECKIQSETLTLTIKRIHGKRNYSNVSFHEYLDAA